YTLTDTSIDSLRFAAYKQNLISNADADENPLGYLGYLWSKAVYGDVFDKRQDNLTKPQLEQLTLNELQELYKSYISNYDGSVILIRTGNSVGEIQLLIEKYLGSLPALKSDARQRKFGGFNVAHSNDSLSIKSPMQMPRTDFLMGYVLDSNAPYSQERDIQHEAFTKFFSELLYDKIRLDDGNVYALSSEYYIPYYCWREEFVRVYAVCAPSYAATLQQKIDHIIRQMAYGDLITPQMLNDYINGRISKLPREIEDKDYFNYFCNYYKNQCTDRRITDEKLLRALTVDDVKALAREYLEKGFKKQVVVSTDVND
ncbi:MAG: insulinase family protein, partial [Bacteroidales bacterium]|nr:insulinase family protein [Bacteroidales bacterium]